MAGCSSGSRGPVRFRQREVTRAVKALEAAGLKLGRVEMTRDGDVNLYPKGPNEAPEASDSGIAKNASDVVADRLR